MKSLRELSRRYLQLLNKVATDDFYQIDLTNRVNCYTCTVCSHITKTIDVDVGVTPMFFTCEKCDYTNKSSFYKDIAPNQFPTIQWYRPNLEQLLKIRKNDVLLEHILKGGLIHRKIII